MNLFLEIIQFILYSGLIVLISKYILVKTLRNLAENLKLKPKTVGDIAGIATSVPELLTISISSFTGFINASIYNVLSSNVINLIQYISAIILNKNKNVLKNKAIKIDIILVIFTIILPLIFVLLKSEINIIMVPIFILLYIGFKKVDNYVHKLYLKNQDEKNEKEDKRKRGDRKNVIKNIIILLITGILLFVIGNLLGSNLENLCIRFNIPELIIGIVLGIVTSIPELITFIESQKHHKKQNNELLGVVEATNNLLMSNILNLFIIQSIGVIIFYVIYG